ncbi:ribosome biogenesis protein tsr1 [Yamadazyma tenuis]|uniref:Bms1-type G domain-containing protein n=1 Tax=Candida tenuis (strain ATCC 10573 / BCRC 21748 / CBS 615 / JCM 9827 / NBRC 10315 / NRRL Y-1498 / VKM Y-70) TaxID=590646 RepID=G3AXC8_CANTC|nr:uncharacterized protein CANTEDRAFT_117079 [Yamadazyma tenuis ATCC 10573]EGV66340.1 hypothetical protein CANTEDRAFT_117079 [Yamadazyma tenuis ATCC 10573]WEJ95532.1 ribosome biogenesis protein tsr1 [Yamadazyma tenuis]
MVQGGHSHRATVKKDHKPFKAKHATKGHLKNITKGKVEKSSGSGKQIKSMSKIERKNQIKQLKENKILETKLTRKVFEGFQGAEKVVTIIPLTNDISAAQIASSLVNIVKDPNEIEYEFKLPSVTNIRVQRFRSNLKIIVPDSNDLLSILDAAKVSDFVLFGISATQEVETTYGEQILRAVTAQGIASVFGVVPNLVSAFPKKNLQNDIRQSLSSYFKHFFPTEEKLYALESESDCLTCIRTICQKFPKSVKWRDARGYMVTDNVYAEDGNLVVLEGTVRGVGFNCNNLIHIPGKGDFQIDHIEKVSREMGDYILPDENQESLEELNPEEVQMEDDWDGFEDEGNNLDYGVRMDGKEYFDDGSRDLQRRKFKVPQGTSEYQSKWLLDDVLEGVSDVESVDEDEFPGFEDNHLEDDDEMEADEDDMNGTTENGESEMFVDLSPEEEQRQLAEFRANAKEDQEFPDEIELHPNESAKDVLNKYRGLKSLANCDWDYDEYDDEAPKEWSRLLRISNYKSTKNKVHKEAIKNAQVTIGNKVKIYIKAPADIIQDCTTKPYIVYGLLEHEHKLAVVNFFYENWEDFEESIPSKETIIAQYGPRRQVIKPIFNQASNSPNNVHKLERFHHPGNASIATCIAPVLFYNAPTIFFRQAEDGSLQIIGQGTFLNCDHTRVVAERAILTGHPLKIHKNVVTVRYMFFNPEDINWFKAVPIYTTSGRTGFIRESLGTHGYLKASFEGKLSAQDVVAMNLYKRTWPEFSTQFNQ